MFPFGNIGRSAGDASAAMTAEQLSNQHCGSAAPPTIEPCINEFLTTDLHHTPRVSNPVACDRRSPCSEYSLPLSWWAPPSSFRAVPDRCVWEARLRPSGLCWSDRARTPHYSPALKLIAKRQICDGSKRMPSIVCVRMHVMACRRSRAVPLLGGSRCLA